jgi:glycerophosphoryl diester phosphodiesterase
MPKITEVAPPSKKAEEWIKSNKEKFKKQYGDNWEPILYAKAWKMFGKKKKVNEHKDPSEYVNKWKKIGFDIDVEDLPNDGKKFKVSNKGVQTIITEPETGVYNTTDGKTFKSFDMAIDHLLKNTFSDINVTESVEYLKKMAGIPKAERKNLNENFSPIADTIVFKKPNDISMMKNRLSDIENSSCEVDPYQINDDDDMTVRELKIACYTSNKILEMINSGKKPERWNLSKITLASDYLTSVYTFMSSLDGENHMPLDESQLTEIFNKKMTPDEQQVANDIYNMAKSSAKLRNDKSPMLNPEFIQYIKRLQNYTIYKDIIEKSWKKGFADGGN